MRASRRGFLTNPVNIARRATIRPACLAQDGVHCRTCGDACDIQAIRFDLRLGKPPLPHVVADRCTGCGDCAAVCPVGAIDVFARHE